MLLINYLIIKRSHTIVSNYHTKLLSGTFPLCQFFQILTQKFFSKFQKIKISLLTAKACKLLVVNCIILFTGCLANAQLKADFNSAPTSGCAPLIVSFNDASTGNPTSWVWDLGNGTTSVLQNPRTTYFNPGTYTVKLIIKNNLGNDTLIKLQYITVYASPVINFSASRLSGCFPLATQFSDLSFAESGSISKWEWDFGDGNNSSLQNPNHTYTSVGNYNVSLRVTNTFGCITSKTIPSYIQIRSGSSALFSNSMPNSCKAPASIDFTNNSTGTGALTYLWNFGDGASSTLTNPTHTYTSPGNYSVTLIVKNTSGCTDTLSKPNLITIGAIKADFTVPETLCQGASFSIINSSNPTPGSTFWDFGDGSVSHSTNPSKVYTNTGNYIIKMIADFGACKDSISKSVTIVAKPKVDFSASPTISCKAPLTVNFTNSSLGGSAYFWDFGDGTTSNTESPSHTYLAEGIYSVKLITTNASGCKDSMVKTDLIQIQSPVISINDLPQNGCAPLQHFFSAQVNSIDPIINYQWNFGDGNVSTSATPSHIYNAPGSYTVTLIYTTKGACTDSVKVVNGIIVGSKPKSDFSANPLNTCAFQNIAFTDNSSGNPNQWYWLFGDGSSSQLQNPIHQYSDTGYFTVTLITINNGCPDTVIFPNYIHIKPPVARFNLIQNCNVREHVVFRDYSVGADTWNWDFGDGSSSTLKDPFHDYPSPGVYKVSLTVTNQSTGCSFTRSETINIVKEIARFITSDSTVCKNSPVTFTANNSNPDNIILYTWRFGDGTSLSASTNSIIHSYAKSSHYSITLILKDINGCFDSIVKPLAMEVDGPTAFFRSIIPSACLNASVTFLDSSLTDGAHAIQQWKWRWGDGTTQSFSAPPFFHAYSLPGNYAVSLIVTDTKGCTDSMQNPNSIIISKPTADFFGDTLSCNTAPVNFYNASSGNGLVYTWDFGDGSSSNEQNPVHLYPIDGTYSISLTIKDIYGCSNTILKTNYVRIANAKANFSLSDSVSTCPPLVVNFTNTSTNYNKWNWNFGDGTTSSADNPSHFYSTAGIFNAVLTVTGPGGCTSQITRQVKVAGPSGSLSYNNLAGCKPLQVNFKASTGKNTSFVWDFNDGNTVPTPDSIISHVYTIPGKYLPKIILIDAGGCRVPVTGNDTIKVYGVTLSFTHTSTLLCDSGTVQFTSAGMNNDLIVNYLWDFGDGATSTEENPLHGYNQPGTYNTSLSIITQRGCKDTVRNTAPVKISKSPRITISGDNNACAPAIMNFAGVIIDSDTSAISWKWNFANGNVSTQQKPPAQNYVTSGNFTINAIASNSNGCTGTFNKQIEIFPLPSLTTSADTVLCLGATSTLQVNGAATYSWTPPTFLSCTNCATAISKPDSSIKYLVKGISDKGCTATDSVIITVKLPFKLNVSKPDTLCVGKSVQLHAGGTENYNWSPAEGLNNTSIASPIASPVSTTVYRVIGMDSKSCFSDTGYIPVTVFPIPVVNAGADKTINVGQQIDILPKISNDVSSVLWSPANGIISNNYPGITVKPSESVEYTIEVKNEGGCLAHDKVSIFVLCNNANIFVPNTFSPNGDGANDIFYTRGSGIFKIKNLKVYNRWGQIVFERSNVNANDASEGWNGSYKGEKLPPDIFVYVLEVVCQNNTTLIFKGNIALIK